MPLPRCWHDMGVASTSNGLVGGGRMGPESAQPASALSSPPLAAPPGEANVSVIGWVAFWAVYWCYDAVPLVLTILLAVWALGATSTWPSASSLSACSPGPAAQASEELSF